MVLERLRCPVFWRLQDAIGRPDRVRPSAKALEMNANDTVVAVFADHAAAEAAIKELTSAGFEMGNLSVVGKGYHTEEKVVGLYNVGDRMKFWGTRGAFWGGLWGLFFGGLFITIPVVGHVMILGYLATVIVTAVENAVLLGGLSVIGAALYGLGIPRDTVLQYESAVKADGFLVMAHGSAAEMARARTILHAANPSQLDLHASEVALETDPQLAGWSLIPKSV